MCIKSHKFMTVLFIVSLRLLHIYDIGVNLNNNCYCKLKLILPLS